MRALAIASMLVACVLAGASTAHAAPPPPADGNAWQEAFGDDFDGTTLDATKWVRCYWWDFGGCTNQGNGELQWYRPDNVIVEDGVLRLRAERTPAVDAYGKAYEYTSGLISSGRGTGSLAAPPKFEFRYGYMEIRAKVPRGKALWPAFWAMPSDHVWPPEIDVMEILGDRTSTSYMGVHWRDGTGAARNAGRNWTGPDFSAGWHVFGVDWRAGSIAWYVDGVERFRHSDAATIPHEPMYLLANLAVGGRWPGAPDESTPFPSDLEVDYIRVWKDEPVSTEPPPDVEPPQEVEPPRDDWRAPAPPAADTPAPPPTETVPPRDTTPPRVTITSPRGGARARRGRPLSLSARAEDDVAVAKVRFYVDGRRVCTDVTERYECTWRPRSWARRHRIAVKAYDRAGNASKRSTTVRG